MPVAYLGPPGSFCHEAALTVETDLTPAASVPAALAAVRDHVVSAAFVPFENSVEGAVAATLDGLASPEATPLQIIGEVLLPVHFALLARPGTTLSGVRTVGTHPHAQAQTRGWLAAQLPAADVALTASTSSAARDVSVGLRDAAVASPAAAKAYGLVVLAGDVADSAGAVTRFVKVAPPSAPGPPTGADRTTVVLFEDTDRPGALLEMLTEFAVRGVNLTRLESRPTGGGLGQYCFHLDADGHLAEARVGEALAALHRICARVAFLGSYPRADGGTSTGGRRSGDTDFARAGAWLARLRAGSS